jgi:hypothetical protein
VTKFNDFMLFDLNTCLKNNCYKSFNEFINHAKDDFPKEHLILSCFYTPILENPELGSFIDDMIMKINFDLLKKYKIHLKNKIFFNCKNNEDDDIMKKILILSHYITILSFLNEFGKTNKPQIQNYLLIQNLINWIEKFILFNYPEKTYKRYDLEEFFSKYLTILNQVSYLEKITLWIKDHKAVIYSMEYISPLKPTKNNPFTAINLNEYKFSNNCLIGIHFSTVNKVFIKNHKAHNLLTFNTTTYIEKSCQKSYTISPILYNIGLETLSKKISFDEMLPSSHGSAWSLKLSELFYLKKQIIENFQTLYFAQSFDTRGRKYAISKFSYTNLKSIRYCAIEKEVINKPLNESKTFKKISMFFYLLEKYKSSNDSINSIYLFLFLNLGKLVKSKKEWRVGLSTFIKLGINAYENKANFIFDDVYDNIEFKSLIFIISEVERFGEDVTNYMICKDATASGWQHLALVLGVEETRKKWLNLDDTPLAQEPFDFYWTDTYSKIIFDFIEEVHMPSSITPYFTRKALKPSIMTVNYGATYYKCWAEFQESIQTSNPLVEKYFKLFYQRLKSLPWFSKKPAELRQKLKTDSIMVFNDALVDFSLYKTLQKRYDYIIAGKRETILLTRLTRDIDQKKTNTALIANFIHASDSEVLRRMQYHQHTVHDCLLIGIKNICHLLDDYEHAFNNLSSKSIFSNKDAYSSIFLLI